MVVIVLIGILAGIAFASMRTQSYANTVRGFSDEIIAEADTARMRASATQRWQRVEFYSDRVYFWQATTVGLTTPTDWELVHRMAAPAHVQVATFNDRTHLANDDSVPAVGDNLPGAVDFSPDGTASAATIFLSDDRERDKLRVLIYRATAAGHLRGGW